VSAEPQQTSGSIGRPRRRLGRRDGSNGSTRAWGAIVVVIGIVAVVATFIVAVLHYHTATDVTTALSPTVGVIAALVGAYFGVRGATLAQGQAIQMMQQQQSPPDQQHGEGEGGQQQQPPPPPIPAV